MTGTRRRLVGTKCILTLTHPDDADALCAAMRGNTVDNLSFFSQHVDIARERAYLERMQANEHHELWYIASHRAPETPIGTIGFHEIDASNRTARLGVLLFARDRRGEGIGTEAIEKLLYDAFFPTEGRTKFEHLEKVYVNLFKTNARAQAYFGGLGFGHEVFLVQEYRLNGERHDMVRLSMFDGEFNPMNFLR